MANFDAHSKNTPLYLDIASNGNGQEKASLTIEASRRLYDEGAESIHTVEIGPGGGAAVHALADALPSVKPEKAGYHLSLVELDQVESSSLTTARGRLEETGATTSFHNANLIEINKVFPEKIDILAASAVLHEVYSYAGGYDALDDSICGIANTLRPGGYFAYRDVHGVENLSQHDRARHIYDRSSWVAFSKLFLEHYIGNAVHPYHRHEDRIAFSQEGRDVKVQNIAVSESLSIEAPIGLLRELQRHYITFRDHAWRTGSLGVRPALEGPEASDWIDRKRGHKRVHYEALATDPLLESVSSQSESGLLVVDGDIFDNTTDVLLNEYLEDIAEKGARSSHWGTWQEWLKREGAETYGYMTLNTLIGTMALRSYHATGKQSILIPTRETDVAVMPRAYYNRYLRNKISNALPDAKQLVLFQSVPLDAKTPEGRKQLADTISDALGALSVHCSQRTLSEIYTPLRKVAS